MMKRTPECLVITLLCLSLAFAVTASLHAQQVSVPLPDASSLQLTAPADVVDSRLLSARGSVNVWVELTDAPLAVAVGKDAKQRGAALNREQQRGYLKQLAQKQDTLANQVRNLGGIELGRVSKSHNAVAVSISASQLNTLAAQPGVRRIRPVIDYSYNLSETVPYIGAAALQSAGVDGHGVRVAVLDSGIDYTHHNMDGSGTSADYAAAYGTSLDDPANQTVNPALFPTTKVIGGTDFVGEHWNQPDAAHCGSNPNGTGKTCLLPDPNPIACGGPLLTAPAPNRCDGTHGTHVADIIGGHSTDNTHKGVAPGVGLYAVKVCSSVTTACSGVALLQGMDFALDPDGDGDISDAVDVVNMSLGSNYGMQEDDLSQASANASNFGVVVVAAAGNAADRPYIVSSPSSTPEVISVAQTQVPGGVGFPLVTNSPAAIASTDGNTATVDWAPIGSGFTGNVAYVGRGCPAGSIAQGSPEDPYSPSTNPSGKVALIDRGACSVSLKVDRAAKAGAIGVLIGLVAAGDAVSFSFGGGDTFVPTLVITLARSNALKSQLAAPPNVTVGGATAVSLAGSMVGSSARGPSVSSNAIKPDIGAPGASVSAVAGTGNGQSAFGGTSGATPMVAGSAALLLQGFPTRTPAEVKALLVNTAEINITTNPMLAPGVLAPITRIGGGEVRVNRAFASQTAAWDADDGTPSLSFGYYAATGPKSFNKSVTVRNYSNRARVYSVSSSFRFAADAASGAVNVSTPSTLFVPANGMASFKVQLRVDTSRLPTWTLNGGSQGGNGPLLQSVEFDGYINIAEGSDNVHVAWQILPHKAAAVQPASNSVQLVGGTGSLSLSNGGATAGRVDVFSFLGSNGKIPPPLQPQPGDNFALIDLKSVGARLVGIGGGQFGVQFAINTFGERAHPNYPAGFQVNIDTNRDGTFDFAVANLENGGFGVSGQNVISVFNLHTAPATLVGTFFFADADLDSGNMIMTAPLSALGMTSSTQFNFSVLAFDNYFTGNLTDAIEGMTYTLGTPRFVGSGVPASGVPAGGSSTLTVQSVAGGDTASPSQAGLLLMYRDARPKAEADAITVLP